MRVSVERKIMSIQDWGLSADWGGTEKPGTYSGKESQDPAVSPKPGEAQGEEPQDPCSELLGVRDGAGV